MNFKNTQEFIESILIGLGNLKFAVNKKYFLILNIYFAAHFASLTIYHPHMTHHSPTSLLRPKVEFWPVEMYKLLGSRRP
jgi:hypothetical protein